MLALSPPRRLIDDMAWCWWTRPRATRIDDTIYFAAVDSTGGMIAATFDIRTGELARQRLAGFEADDHNNPALVAVAGRPLVCFYSRHDAEEGVRFRISAAPGDISRWHEEQILTFGGS